MVTRGHVPHRTCAGCGRRDTKGVLVRFTTAGSASGEKLVVLDTAGRGEGRGAYLCPSIACFDRATAKRGLLARRLRARGLRPGLREEFACLVEGR